MFKKKKKNAWDYESEKEKKETLKTLVMTGTIPLAICGFFSLSGIYVSKTLDGSEGIIETLLTGIYSVAALVLGGIGFWISVVVSIGCAFRFVWTWFQPTSEEVRKIDDEEMAQANRLAELQKETEQLNNY